MFVLPRTFLIACVFKINVDYVRKKKTLKSSKKEKTLYEIYATENANLSICFEFS